MTLAEELAAAGAYDPGAPDAAERLALFEALAARGATAPQIVAAVQAHELPVLAASVALRSGARVGARALATQVGLAVEQVEALTLAAGLPPRGADEPGYTDDDRAMCEAFRVAAPLFGEDATLRFVRVVGSSMTRMAEAAVSLFLVQIEGPLRASGGSHVALAQQNLVAIESLGQVRTLVQSMFAAHVELAIRRLREARRRLSVDSATLAIGFVDLVGFTTLARQIDARALADVIERFEATAYDVATAHDGRVVKLVGDEVMFATRDPAAACAIALTLVERFAGDPAVTPRGGVAYGDVLVRGGDYYGPIVNLAARIAELAVPQEILVTQALVDHASAAGLRFVPAGRRLLKGFEEPVLLSAVDRLHPAPSAG